MNKIPAYVAPHKSSITIENIAFDGGEQTFDIKALTVEDITQIYEMFSEDIENVFISVREHFSGQIVPDEDTLTEILLLSSSMYPQLTAAIIASSMGDVSDYEELMSYPVGDLLTHLIDVLNLTVGGSEGIENFTEALTRLVDTTVTQIKAMDAKTASKQS